MKTEFISRRGGRGNKKFSGPRRGGINKPFRSGGGSGPKGGSISNQV